jgi:hypothetical protein
MLLNENLTQPARVVPYLNPIVIHAIHDYFYRGQDSLALRIRELGIQHPGLFKGQYKMLLHWETKLPLIPYVLIASSVSLSFVTVPKIYLTFL